MRNAVSAAAAGCLSGAAEAKTAAGGLNGAVAVETAAAGVVGIKICGLTKACEIEWVNELKPEFIGFVFAPASRRYVEPGAAAQLRSMLAPGIRAAGVFVDEEETQVAELAERGIIDIVQLHGSEDEEYIARLRMLTGAPIIKAFSVKTTEDMQRARECTADYVLLDSGSGGTGRTFDWSLVEDLGKPWFLAGGLDAENVKQALAIHVPFAVDVSSGVETDGKKDRIKMADFVNAVRGAAETAG